MSCGRVVSSLLKDSLWFPVYKPNEIQCNRLQKRVVGCKTLDLTEGADVAKLALAVISLQASFKLMWLDIVVK